VFAIVDVSGRPSRGQILMLIEDQGTATEIATELNRRATVVSVHSISPEQLAHFRADLADRS
jgi:hypothetical protein